MYLKAIIFSVCFLGLSFIGMQVVVKMRANEAAFRRAAAAKKAARQAEEKQAEAEEKQAEEKQAEGKQAEGKQAEASAPKSKSGPPPASPFQSPDKLPGPSSQMPLIVNASRGNDPEITPPMSFTKQRPTKQMSFTAIDVNQHGVPSRVKIHNTPVGDYTILLIGTRNSTGIG